MKEKDSLAEKQSMGRLGAQAGPELPIRVMKTGVKEHRVTGKLKEGQAGCITEVGWEP